MKWNAYVPDLSIEIEIELTAQIESFYENCWVLLEQEWNGEVVTKW